MPCDEHSLIVRTFASPATRHLFDVPDEEVFSSWEDRSLPLREICERWRTNEPLAKKHVVLRYALHGRDYVHRRGVASGSGDLSLLSDEEVVSEYGGSDTPVADMVAKHHVHPNTVCVYAKLAHARLGIPWRPQKNRNPLANMSPQELISLWEHPGIGSRGIQERYGVSWDTASRAIRRAYAKSGMAYRPMTEIPVTWERGQPADAPKTAALPFGVAELNYVTSTLECGGSVEDAARGLNLPAETLLAEYSGTGIDLSEGWPYVQRGVWNVWAGRRILDEGIFDAIDTPAKAWLLGLLLADGSLHRGPGNRPDIELALRWDDAETVFAARDILGSNMRIAFDDISSSSRNPAARARLCVRSDHLFRQLESLGIGQQKSFTAELPLVGDDMMPHFLRGVWDGDGSVMPFRGHPRETRWVLSVVGSIPFAEATRSWLMGHRIVANAPFVVDKRNPRILGVSVTRRDDVRSLVEWMWGERVHYLPAMSRKRKRAALALAWAKSPSPASMRRTRASSS